jgi:hypothetical protein
MLCKPIAQSIFLPYKMESTQIGQARVSFNVFNPNGQNGNVCWLSLRIADNAQSDTAIISISTFSPNHYRCTCIVMPIRLFITLARVTKWDHRYLVGTKCEC